MSPEERAAAWAEYENERVTGYTTLQQQQQQAAQQQMLLKQAAQQQAAAAKQQALLKRQQEQQAKKLQQKMSRTSVFPSTRYDCESQIVTLTRPFGVVLWILD